MLLLRVETCDYVFYTNENRLAETEESSFVDLENEMLNYPRDFIERIDRTLSNLSRKYPHFGDGFIHSNTLARSLFLEAGDDVAFCIASFKRFELFGDPQWF